MERIIAQRRSVDNGTGPGPHPAQTPARVRLRNWLRGAHGAVCAGVLAVSLLLASACSAGTPLPWTDDFSDPAGGWRARPDDSALVAYEGGVMRVLVREPNRLAWASAGRDLRDMRLTVEATQVAGPDDNEYGLLARMEDSERFYCFAISGDGYFRVTLYDQGDRELLSGDWLPSNAIHRGEATNRLELVCDGSELTFLVNGTQLAQVVDTTLRHGDVGLYAGAFFQPGVEIHFDNLVAAAP